MEALWQCLTCLRRSAFDGSGEQALEFEFTLCFEKRLCPLDEFTRCRGNAISASTLKLILDTTQLAVGLIPSKVVRLQEAVVDDDIVKRQQHELDTRRSRPDFVFELIGHAANREHTCLAHKQAASTLVAHERVEIRKRILPSSCHVETLLWQPIWIRAHELVDDLDIVPKLAGNHRRLHVVHHGARLERKVFDHVKTLVDVIQQRVHRVEESIDLFVV